MTTTNTMRAPAVAGRFYPGGAQALATQVAALLRGVPALPSVPLAVVSPPCGLSLFGAAYGAGAGGGAGCGPDPDRGAVAVAPACL